MHFAVVRKKDVDQAIVDQAAEIIAMARNAESIGQGERNFASCRAGNVDRSAHRGARFLGIPQIAFEIEDRAVGDQVGIDGGSRQELRSAQKGVHRPLAIGRDKDQAACRRRVCRARGRIEAHTDGANVMREDFAKLVARHLPDKTAFATQRGHARNRVCRRPARNFLARPHAAVKLGSAGIVDQLHRTAREVFGNNEILARAGDHVDNGIADGGYVICHCHPKSVHAELVEALSFTLSGSKGKGRASTSSA